MTVTYAGDGSYQHYLQLRLDAGWDADLAMIEKVWDGMEPAGRAGAIAQYLIMAANYKASKAAFAERGLSWGTF